MSTALPQRTNFVGGEWVDPLTDAKQEILNPSTSEVIGHVPSGGADDVDRAVRAAADAFVEWFETTPKERADMLLALADALDAHTEELAQIESANVGKPLPMARDEVGFASDNLRFSRAPRAACPVLMSARMSTSSWRGVPRTPQRSASIAAPGVLKRRC